MNREINLFQQDLFAQQNIGPKPATEHVLDGIQAKLHELEMRKKAKLIIEALLFASQDPISFVKIREVVDTFYTFKPRVLRDLISELERTYLEKHAFILEEIAQGFALRTRDELSPYLGELFRNKRTEKLSQAASEVLAIIAYRQPITRPQIDAIRGVDSSGIIYTLLERQLIMPVGKAETTGKPTLYGITNEFLKHYGLKDVKELPKLDVDQKNSK